VPFPDATELAEIARRTTQARGSSSTGSGSALPRTGTDAGALALLGALMLGFGVAMRRRSASA